MSTLHTLIRAFLLESLILALALAGCATNDFDKGLPLGEVSLSGPSGFERDVALGTGSADLAIAVRDGKCKPVTEGTTVDVTIVGMGATVERSLRVGELSWAYAEKSCDAYGYLYDVGTGLSKKFDLEAGQYHVRVKVRSFDKAESRIASVWIIYGGRAPTTRMFSGSAPIW